jgi:hypothetical protein
MLENVTEFLEYILQLFISRSICIWWCLKNLQTNQVSSILKEVELNFITSLLNHNPKCYYKMNLSVQTIFYPTYCRTGKLLSKFLLEKHSSKTSYWFILSWSQPILGKQEVIF